MSKLSVIFILIILFPVLKIDSYADVNINRDPFKPKYNISCNEQTLILLKRLQEWRLKGVIQSSDNTYQAIWLLASQSNWLHVPINSIPRILQPWKIESITQHYVSWKADAMEGCNNIVTLTMPLNQE